MLKKDLYANAYILTTLVIAGAVAYYVFVLQKEVMGVFNQDPKVIEVSSDQARIGQQLVKAAIGMGYSTTERNFNIFKNEIRRIYPSWTKGHLALQAGDADLGVIQPYESDEYLALQEALRFSYFEIDNNVKNLLDVDFTENTTDVNALSLRKSIEILINTSRDYQNAQSAITTYFVNNAQNRNTSLSLSEYVGYGLLLLLLTVQGVFLFRPLVKLAGENYLSANKAFVRLQKSEKQLNDQLPETKAN